MIKLVLILLVLACTGKIGAQVASRLAPSNATIAVGSPTNFLWVKPDSSPTSQIYTSTWDSLNVIKRIRDSLSNRYTKQQADAKFKLSTAVTTLAVVGSSLTAGGNTVYLDYVHSANYNWSALPGKPSFAPVAISGDYSDLLNQPSIPSALNGTGFVKSTGTVVSYDNSSYYLDSNPSGFISSYTPTLGVSGNSIYASGGNSVSIPAQSFSSISGKPTTISGYGITDAYPLSGNPSGFLTSQTVYQAASGILQSGTNPVSLFVDSTKYMSQSVATPIISAMTGSINANSSGINGRVPQSRVLTINGTAQDLSSDRTWSIPTGSVYSAGTGISFSGSVIANTSPAVTQTLTGAGITSVTSGSNSYTITTTPTCALTSTGTAITSGTAFRPKANGPCHIIINGSLTGIVGLNETVTVALSATQNGIYSTITSDVLLIGVLGLTLDRSVASFPVPYNATDGGWWVKVTRSGSATTLNYTLLSK